MDQMTQQNAAMVEETTAASHALSQETTALSEMISQFKLGQTGADQHTRRDVRSGASSAARPRLKAVAGARR